MNSGKVKHPSYGLRDVAFNTEQNQVIVVASDVTVGSIVKKVLSFSWLFKKKSDKDTVADCACVESFPFSIKEGKLVVGEESALRLTFKVHAICIEYCPVSNTLLVGLEDGSIMGFEVGPEWKTTQIADYRPQKKRCVAMAIDSQRGLVFSISQGPHLNVYDYKKKQLLSENIIASEGLSFMILTEDKMKAIVADNSGVISIFDLSKVLKG